MPQWVNPSSRTTAYMRQLIGSALVQIMACRHQAPGKNFSEILLKISNFSFNKMHLQMSFAKWRPFCPGGDELMGVSLWRTSLPITCNFVTEGARSIRDVLVYNFDFWQTFKQMYNWGISSDNLSHGNLLLPGMSIHIVTVTPFLLLPAEWFPSKVAAILFIYYFTEAEWRVYASENLPSLVQIMACRLVGAKPLSEPILEYCSLGPYEQTSMNI